MKNLGFSLLLSCSLFVVGCDVSSNKKADHAPTQGHQIHTKMYFEYFQKTGVNIQVEDEQEFHFQEIADMAILKRRFAVTTSYNPKESYPTALGITNVWANSKNRNVPRVDLDFFFKETRIEIGKVITCTPNRASNCFLDLSSTTYNMDIPNKDVVCKIKIETGVSLDFSASEPRPMWRGISFPSSLDEAPLEGSPFAISVRCTSEAKIILNGYFLHNTKAVPSL